MDPTAMLRDIIQFLIDGKYDQARHLVDELQAWTDRGGFSPDLGAVLAWEYRRETYSQDVEQ